MGLIKESTEKKILDFLKENIKFYDLVIISDFGHGLMTPKIINFLIRAAKKLSINTQTNSTNFGFNLLSKYQKAGRGKKLSRKNLLFKDLRKLSRSKKKYK